MLVTVEFSGSLLVEICERQYCESSIGERNDFRQLREKITIYGGKRTTTIQFFFDMKVIRISDNVLIAEFY